MIVKMSLYMDVSEFFKDMKPLAKISRDNWTFIPRIDETIRVNEFEVVCRDYCKERGYPESLTVRVAHVHHTQIGPIVVCVIDTRFGS